MQRGAALFAARARLTSLSDVALAAARYNARYIVSALRARYNALRIQSSAFEPSQTARAPGNLANTSDGSDAGNNARLCYKRGSPFASLVAVRLIKAGEEVLTPYGRKYTADLRAAHASAAALPPRPHPFADVQCGACGAHLQHKDLARHARGFACPARRSPKGRAARPKRGDT